jgi:hypothetical protein
LSTAKDDLKKFNEIMQPEHNVVQTGNPPISIPRTIGRLIARAIKGSK